MTISNLTGNECGTEIAKKINDIIAQKATISLSNLDAAGEQRFTNLASDISDVNDLVTALTTVVNGKLSAECLLQQNGYIKFSNGFIIQFGLGTRSGNDYNVTFPLSYNTGGIALALDNVGYYGSAHMSVKTLTKTGANFYSTSDASFMNWLSCGF